MWICECGFKNSNSNSSCHGKECRRLCPADMDAIKEKRQERLEKRKDSVTKQIGDEQAMRRLKKMLGI